MEKERQLKNLQELRNKKTRRMNELLAKKFLQGQIRENNDTIYLIHLKNDKLKAELAVIDEEMKTLHDEIKALS